MTVKTTQSRPTFVVEEQQKGEHVFYELDLSRSPDRPCVRVDKSDATSADVILYQRDLLPTGAKIKITLEDEQKDIEQACFAFVIGLLRLDWYEQHQAD